MTPAAGGGPEGREAGRRRLLVGLDPGTGSVEALELAVAVAHGLGAEIEGLFVEDLELIDLAGLSFLRQTSLTTGRAAPLDPARLAVELEIMGRDMRRALAAAAERRALGWSFRTIRERRRAALAAAAEAAALMLLPFAAAPAGWRSARPPDDGLSGPVAVLYAGPGDRVALDTAARLARDTRQRLTVVLAGHPAQATDAGEAEVRAAIGAVDDAPEPVFTVAEAGSPAVPGIPTPGGLVVAGRDSVRLLGDDAEAVARAANRLGACVLVVR